MTTLEKLLEQARSGTLVGVRKRQKEDGTWTIYCGVWGNCETLDHNLAEEPSAEDMWEAYETSWQRDVSAKLCTAEEEKEEYEEAMLDTARSLLRDAGFLSTRFKRLAVFVLPDRMVLVQPEYQFDESIAFNIFEVEPGEEMDEGDDGQTRYTVLDTVQYLKERFTQP